AWSASIRATSRRNFSKGWFVQRSLCRTSQNRLLASLVLRKMHAPCAPLFLEATRSLTCRGIVEHASRLPYVRIHHAVVRLGCVWIFRRHGFRSLGCRSGSETAKPRRRSKENDRREFQRSVRRLPQ